MLYDPKWQKPEVKADPFSLESLIAWLEKQPAGETYCYLDNGRCLLGQYFSAQGFSNVSVCSFWLSADGMSERDLPPLFDDIAVGWAPIHGGPEGHTFGAALERARAVAAR